MSFEDGILKDLGKVDLLCLTHFGASLDERRRLLSFQVLHRVSNRLMCHILDIPDALWRATAEKFNQA